MVGRKGSDKKGKRSLPGERGSAGGQGQTGNRAPGDHILHSGGRGSHSSRSQEGTGVDFPQTLPAMELVGSSHTHLGSPVPKATLHTQATGSYLLDLTNI